SAKWFSKSHEYLLVYSKNKELLQTNFLELDEETKKAYKNQENDSRGEYRMLACWARGTQGGVDYDFTNQHGQYFSKRLWLFSKDNLTRMDVENRLIIRGDNVYRKLFIDENKGKIPETLWLNVSNAANAADEIKNLFGNIVFDTPKPIPYIQEMLKIVTVSTSNDLILDFFAGSGTTAQAVMELNVEDGGNRRCICVQMPEVLDEKSEAYKAGYRTIADITRARIAKVIAKLKAEQPEHTADLACANFTLTPSHFKAWRADVGAADLARQLEIFQNTEKPTSSHADMLVELLLKMGLGLVGVDVITQPLDVAGCEIQRVLLPDNRVLWVCFSPYLVALKAEIVKAKPQQVLMLNSCFISNKADERLTNLQLELAANDIRLTVI
ncbi:MAG: DNA methyltransferase, partial [Sulfuriferula sp.]